MHLPLDKGRFFVYICKNVWGKRHARLISKKEISSRMISNDL